VVAVNVGGETESGNFKKGFMERGICEKRMLWKKGFMG